MLRILVRSISVFLFCFTLFNVVSHMLFQMLFQMFLMFLICFVVSNVVYVVSNVVSNVFNVFDLFYIVLCCSKCCLLLFQKIQMWFNCCLNVVKEPPNLLRNVSQEGPSIAI